MKTKTDSDTAIWYCHAAAERKLGFQYHPEKIKPGYTKKDYGCIDKWFETKEACEVECAKLNRATKIGKNGMAAKGKKYYEKMTVRKLIAKLQALENQDQEIVIYPKYTGADCDTLSKYRFTIAEMADQWHQYYPYIALMF